MLKTKNIKFKFICMMLAVVMMVLMATPVFASNEIVVSEKDEIIFCDDCDHFELDETSIPEEPINEKSNNGCTSIFGHNWVWDYETMTYSNPNNKATHCYFNEIYRRDFERCTRCGMKTASTFYYWKVESRYHSFSGNTCTLCGYKK